MVTMLKEKAKQLKNSKMVVNRMLFVCLKGAWTLARFTIDGSLRSTFLTKLKYGNRYHQHSSYTSSNRYPLIFQTCAEHLASTLNPKILSFGCSTGEEVGSLGCYIPTATIVGVDINRWSLRQCRKKYRNPRFLFQHRFSSEFETQENFDAIFCMAVFQRTENRTNVDNTQAQGFLFDDFEREVGMLDKKLKQGGLLVIDNADFSFTETSISEKYSPLDFEGNKIERKRPLFDRHNHKVSNSHSCFRVFVKYSE